jgi:WD40 repeat protein/serine/threonine protein kinase
MNTAQPAPDLPQAEAGSSAEVHPVEALAAEYLRRHRQGERPSLAEYLERYPELAEQIRAVFPALIALEQLKPASAGAGTAAGLARREQVGAYRLLRVLGRGGMGVVYEAEHESLGRRVALKVLPVDAAGDAKLLERFRREARAAAQLHHSNIVPVFEVGQEGDTFFYAMQYIQGQPLDAVIQELRRLRTVPADRAPQAGPAAPPLPTDATIDSGSGRVTDTPASAEPSGPSELSMVASNYRLFCRNVARLGLQVAEALAYAHARGIVHRDIKPANLLLDTTGVAWVSDFGLVKTQDPALTDTGDFVGTLRYMAPERFRGECDVRADVYALGLTLYELLVLRPAFDGQDRLHLVEQIGTQEPARPRTLDPRIPRDLETILMKAIEKDPRRRYPSAAALAGDLRRFLADEPIRARRVGPLERLGRWGRRNPLVASLSTAVVLVAAVGFAGVFGQMQEAKKERDEVKALNEKLRRTLYAAHMNLAQQAWEAGDSDRVRELLEQHRPRQGETDLRGFEWFYLYRLCHSDLLTLKHAGKVRCVAYSPDGTRLASASSPFGPQAGEVKVWDAQTGRELHTLKGYHGRVHSMAYSPDGKRLATASLDGTIKVWDARTGKEILTLHRGGKAGPKGVFGRVISIAFSPDGKRLAGGVDTPGQPMPGGLIKVWDAQTGEELLKLQGPAGRTIVSVAFSPDGKRLAGTSSDNTVRVWDAKTGEKLLTFQGPSSVTFSPDGKSLACPFGDKMVKVWDAETGKDLLTLRGHTDGVRSVAFSPDGKHLASASRDRTVKVWDVQAGHELFSLKGHSGYVNGVTFSPDGKRLASASEDGTVKVWDAQAGPQPRTLKGEGRVLRVAVSLDGKRLATIRAILAPGKGPGTEVKVLDAQTGKALLTLQGHTNPVWCVALSPDGKRLATGGVTGEPLKQRMGEVKVWDVQTGKELLTLKEKAREVHSVAFSPDGERLASAGLDFDRDNERSVVRVWNAQTGEELHCLPGGESSVTFSPDGTRLASASYDNTVTVFDARNGKKLRSLPQPFWGVAYSPDGKHLTTTGKGGMKVWDAETGKEIRTLKGHAGVVKSAAYSPDGKRLASASGDGTVKVWDTQTDRELLTLKGHNGSVHGVVFASAGHRLVSFAADGTVIFWDATPPLAKR